MTKVTWPEAAIAIAFFALLYFASLPHDKVCKWECKKVGSEIQCGERK